MTAANPALNALIERVKDAHRRRTALCIRGHGSKDFYGEAPLGEHLSTLDLRGISSYEPTELVITAKAGTPLVELEAALLEKGQHLPFEPPRFGSDKGTGSGTVGGMVAAGLAGPSRAAVGSVRDHVLGLTMLNGRGELLSFGGQVMKNVAGYDVSRLMAGSLGTLGLILEVSLKVLPLPTATKTLRFEMGQAQALAQLNAWGRQPLPIHASCWYDEQLWLRLQGASAAVGQAATELNSALHGSQVDPSTAEAFWLSLRDQTHSFFRQAQASNTTGCQLWRLSLPSNTPTLDVSGPTLVEWGGAQRWVRVEAADGKPQVEMTGASSAADRMRNLAARSGGHAVLFRATDKAGGAFAALSPPLARIHHAVKASFDPHRIFNPGRLYPEL